MRRDGGHFQPRLDLSPEYMEKLRIHLDWVKAQEEAGKLPRNDTWRKFTMFYGLTADSCRHTTRSLVEVETDHGVWGMEICVECGRQVAGPECPHIHNTWHLDGKVLICDNCGMDVT